ncbi:MAG: hypothetical protein ACI4IG_00680 [Eubacterium sp.]
MSGKSITPSIDEIIGAADNDLGEIKATTSSDSNALFDENNWFLQPYKVARAKHVPPNQQVRPNVQPVQRVQPTGRPPVVRQYPPNTVVQQNPGNRPVQTQYNNLNKQQQPVKKNTTTRILVFVMIAVVACIAVIFFAANVGMIMPSTKHLFDSAIISTFDSASCQFINLTFNM